MRNHGHELNFQISLLIVAFFLGIHVRFGGVGGIYIHVLITLYPAKNFDFMELNLSEHCVNWDSKKHWNLVWVDDHWRTRIKQLPMYNSKISPSDRPEKEIGIRLRISE